MNSLATPMSNIPDEGRRRRLAAAYDLILAWLRKYGDSSLVPSSDADSPAPSKETIDEQQ